MSISSAAGAAVKSREFGTVLIMALGFGLVGIDRFLISTLFPVIARDLHLSYGDIGIISGVLAFAWGAAALVAGIISDRIGRKIVVVVSLALFGILIGLSGLAAGLIGLCLVRILMGFADGAFAPAGILETLAASPPRRHGRNIGLQQMTLTLFGLGLCPLIVAALLHVIDWRLIFVVFAPPGIVLAIVAWYYLPKPSPAPVRAADRTTLSDIKTALGIPNVRILMGFMLCWLVCLMTTSALFPSYLTDHLKLDLGQMGIVMSSIGLGAAAGTLTLPWLSDFIGRKPVMLLASVGAAASLWALSSIGSDVQLLFWALFCVHFFNNALITLTVGPICAESTPAHLVGTAAGVIIATGEFFGGGVAPVLAGFVAETFGIGHILWLPMAALMVGFVLALMLKETRPRRRLAPV